MSSNCFILGCARNCETYIPAVFSNISTLSGLFRNIRIIIAYDPSSDNTLQQLQLQQQTRFPDNMEILVNTEPLSPIRTQRISNARNRLLHKMREQYSLGWDYFIMVDLDDVCASPIKLEPLQNALSRSDWDMLSFDRPEYYDVWALSYSPYVVSCWNWGDQKTCESIVWFMREDIQNRLNQTPENEYYPCNSAFNGIAIYRYTKFVDCHYDWRTLDFGSLPRNDLIHSISLFNLFPVYRPCLDDCEHREFHRQAIAKHNAKICISKEYLF